MKKKRLRELTIKDNFLFSAVMLDEKNCRGFLELLVQLQTSVAQIKSSREMGGRYMTLEEWMEDEREIAHAEGHAEGLAEGQVTYCKVTH